MAMPYTPPLSAVYFLKKGHHKQSRFFCSTADSSPDEAPDGWLWYGWFLDQDGGSNLAHPLRFGQGIQAPRWLQFTLKMHPVNEAAAPSPSQIRPHTATRRSKMVFWWGVRGGFVLSHQEASLESMGGWWWGAPYCKWISCVCSLFLLVVDVCVCSFLRYALLLYTWPQLTTPKLGANSPQLLVG